MQIIILNKQILVLVRVIIFKRITITSIASKEVQVMVERTFDLRYKEREERCF